MSRCAYKLFIITLTTLFIFSNLFLWTYKLTMMDERRVLIASLNSNKGDNRDYNKAGNRINNNRDNNSFNNNKDGNRSNNNNRDDNSYNNRQCDEQHYESACNMLMNSGIDFLDFSGFERTNVPSETTGGFDYTVKEMPALVRKWRNDALNLNWKPVDIMNSTRPKFLPQYKNPCYRDSHDVLRCLPHFLIVGVPKAGTTELHAKLSMHPDIVMQGKELRWFTAARMDGTTLTQYSKRWFSKMAELPPNKIQHAVTGEATPIYFSDNSYWMDAPENEGFTDPTVLAPHLVRHLLPNARLILTLRDPVERLYSGYKAFSAWSRPAYRATPEDFHDRVVNSTAWLYQCFKTLPRRHCLYDFPHRNRTLFPKFYHHGLYGVTMARARIGLYSELLEDWLGVFPREQILIVTLEEYSKNKTHTLNRVFSHIGVEPLAESLMKEDAFHKVVNKNVNRFPDMFNKTRDILYEFYRPFNQKLACMLNSDEFLWEHKKTTTG